MGWAIWCNAPSSRTAAAEGDAIWNEATPCGLRRRGAVNYDDTTWAHVGCDRKCAAGTPCWLRRPDSDGGQPNAASTWWTAPTPETAADMQAQLRPHVGCGDPVPRSGGLRRLDRPLQRTHVSNRDPMRAATTQGGLRRPVGLRRLCGLRRTRVVETASVQGERKPSLGARRDHPRGDSSHICQALLRQRLRASTRPPAR